MNSSPLVKYPDINVVLPPVYCGSVRYYAAMAQYGAVTKIDKQFYIAGICRTQVVGIVLEVGGAAIGGAWHSMAR